MAWLKQDSLEHYLQYKLLVLFIPTGLFLGLWLNQISVKWQWIFVAELALFSLYLLINSMVKLRVMRAFTRASLHLDAIGQDDFNQFAKSSFSAGKVKEFHGQLKELSEQLQAQKSRYDQHGFLIYHLISQLASPIMVLNAKQQLTFGNDAFSQLFTQSWQMYRHASPELLNLRWKDQQWEFITPPLYQRWQIKHSQFIDDGEIHYMLIFIDIGSAIRESQLHAWQQIIRVLGHEIRNSLTPVSSMAESLFDKSESPRDKEILNVITERCLHLQEFVDRYASLSKHHALNFQAINLKQFVSNIAQLFKDVKIECKGSAESLCADLGFLEQVFINLIKNSVEAGAKSITINAQQQEQFCIVEIVDNGCGFKNLDNVFVPLYSTKPQGQGIGLSFCRNIIEQHNGVLEIHNNDESTGVTAMIILPKAHTAK